MRFNEQYCSITHGGGESLQQLTKTSESKHPALTSPVCKAAVLLVKSHVNMYVVHVGMSYIYIYIYGRNINIGTDDINIPACLQGAL